MCKAWPLCGPDDARCRAVINESPLVAGFLCLLLLMREEREIYFMMQHFYVTFLDDEDYRNENRDNHRKNDILFTIEHRI